MDAPAAAVSADGKTIAIAWMDQRRGRQERDVFWRILKNGKPGPEMALAPDQSGTQGHVALAIDKKGVVHAVWTSDGKILYRTSKDKEAKQISDSSEREAAQPSLVIQGDVIIAAYEARKGGDKVSIVRRLK